MVICVVAGVYSEVSCPCSDSLTRPFHGLWNFFSMFSGKLWTILGEWSLFGQVKSSLPYSRKWFVKSIWSKLIKLCRAVMMIKLFHIGLTKASYENDFLLLLVAESWKTVSYYELFESLKLLECFWWLFVCLLAVVVLIGRITDMSTSIWRKFKKKIRSNCSIDLVVVILFIHKIGEYQWKHHVKHGYYLWVTVLNKSCV